MTLIILRLIMLIFVVVAYVMVNSIVAEKYDSKQQGKEFNIVFKILVNHSQQIGVLMMPKIIAESKTFKGYLKFFDYFSMGNPQIVSNECAYYTEYTYNNFLGFDIFLQEKSYKETFSFKIRSFPNSLYLSLLFSNIENLPGAFSMCATGHRIKISFLKTIT